jgi:hypothetical protein
VLPLLLRYALAISLLLALPPMLIQPQPDDDRALQLLLPPPEVCAQPCLLGIRPGITPLDEALALLAAHPWVADFEIDYLFDDPAYATGIVRWIWSGAQPAAIDGRFPGVLNFHTQRRIRLVEAISIQTTLRPPQLIDALGRPAEGLLWRRAERIVYGTLYRPQQYAALVGVSAAMRCPVNHLDYWYSDSELFMTTWEGMGGPLVSLNAAMESC